MSDQPPMPPMTSDFPDHWGFYLLQAINRLDDKIDDVRRDQERTANALRQDIHALDAKIDQKVDALDAKIDQKIDALDAKFDQKIDALDTKFDQKLTGLQYWYWGTLVVIIVGFVTIFLSHT
ncbi:MAG: hemolysin XhlA family protein [Firmicutes bacterium]|nr:hemolysin XhlA family protein [Bacillota bacterium]